MEPEIPHFSLPFRFERSGAHGMIAMSEQDSIDDIANCVELIVRTPINWRDESPDFGIPDLTFKILPIRPETIEQLVSPLEPRVKILVREQPSRLDALVDILTVELQARGATS